MFCHRTTEKYFKKITNQTGALLVTGARQVGKTTLLQELCEKDRTYVTLDDPLIRELANRDPRLFLQRFPPPVLIDEVQYAPELFPYLKMEIDQRREKNLFWLTGSQPFPLMKNVSESLAGRVSLVQLLGLSYRERKGLALDVPPFLPVAENLKSRQQKCTLTLNVLYEMIWRGSFPAIALNPDLDRNLFYSSYVQTYLQRDVRDWTQIGDELSFLRFLKVAAARTGQQINFTDMARDADISPNTAKNWLSVLHASGIIYLLQPYHNNLNLRLSKTPKLYFMDTGLCAWLTQWSSPQTLETGAMSGAFLETWVLGEVLKSYWHTGNQPAIFYYRDKDQREIDLIFESDGKLFPVEIKKTAAPNLAHAKHFSVLEKLKKPVGTGVILSLYPEYLPLDEKTVALPVGNV